MDGIFKCKRCSACCKSEEKGISFSPSIFDFEAKAIKKRAKLLGIKIVLIPSLFISDSKSKKNLVIQYMLDRSDKCYFLRGKKCLVYDIRPIICRSFPVISSGIKEGFFLKSGGCIADKKIAGKKRATIGELIELYGDCYCDSALACFINEEEKKIVRMLIDKKQLSAEKLRSAYPYIGITDYFKSKKIKVMDYDSEIKTLKNTKERLKHEIKNRISMV